MLYFIFFDFFNNKKMYFSLCIETMHYLIIKIKMKSTVVMNDAFPSVRSDDKRKQTLPDLIQFKA